MKEPSNQPRKLPFASICMVSYKNFETSTRPCLESLFKLSEFNELQIIIVDNASGKETTDKIQELTQDKANIEFIPNEINRGFPGGANDAARRASADIIFFLDVDTIVPDGALRKLAGFVEQNPNWIVGPVTNESGNEQKLYSQSSDPHEILREGAEWCRHAHSSTIKVHQLDLFCAGLNRKVLEDVGPLDEGFGMGYYEDTDFCRRARQKEYPLMMIEEVFVFHKGGGTGLSSKEQLRKNREFFLEKHGKAGHTSLLRQRNVNLRAINCYAQMLEYRPFRKDEISYRAKKRLHFAALLWPKSPIKKLLYAMEISVAKKKLRHQGLSV